MGTNFFTGKYQATHTGNENMDKITRKTANFTIEGTITFCVIFVRALKKIASGFV